jgi:excisionase family DNA binding protein
MTKPASAPRLFSIADIAAFMTVSTKTVRRMVERGELPVHRIGHQLRVTESDLERFLAMNRGSSRRMSVNVH